MGSAALAFVERLRAHLGLKLALVVGLCALLCVPYYTLQRLGAWRAATMPATAIRGGMIHLQREPQRHVTGGDPLGAAVKQRFAATGREVSRLPQSYGSDVAAGGVFHMRASPLDSPPPHTNNALITIPQMRPS